MKRTLLVGVLIALAACNTDLQVLSPHERVAPGDATPGDAELGDAAVPVGRDGRADPRRVGVAARRRGHARCRRPRRRSHRAHRRRSGRRRSAAPCRTRDHRVCADLHGAGRSAVLLGRRHTTRSRRARRRDPAASARRSPTSRTSTCARVSSTAARCAPTAHSRAGAPTSSASWAWATFSRASSRPKLTTRRFHSDRVRRPQHLRHRAARRAVLLGRQQRGQARARRSAARGAGHQARHGRACPRRLRSTVLARERRPGPRVRHQRGLALLLGSQRQGSARRARDRRSSCADPCAVEAGSRFVRVGAGQRHTCAIDGDGKLLCWGENIDGLLGLQTEAAIVRTPTAVGDDSDHVEVAANWFHTCALKKGGTLECWGRNEEGQLGQGDAGARAPCPRASAPSSAGSPSRSASSTAAPSTPRGPGAGASTWKVELGTGDTARKYLPTRVVLP